MTGDLTDSSAVAARTPPVTVVTVTYNAARTLPGMLASIRAMPGGDTVPVIAVDNGSTDGTLAILRAQRGVHVIAQQNTGYGHGVNRGIRAAPADQDVLVLNPDVTLHPDALPRLHQVLDDHPQVAIVVPQLLGPDGAVQPSLRRSPTPSRTLAETVLGGRRARRFGEAYAPRPGPGLQPAAWATGAAMLIRREAYERLGPLVERFFLYSEETEYCLRAGDAGYVVLCEQAAVLTHIGGDLGRNRHLWALRAVNRVRLHGDRHGPAAALRMRAASIAFELRRVATGDPVSRTALAALTCADLEATADALIRRLGGVAPTPAGPTAPPPAGVPAVAAEPETVVPVTRAPTVAAPRPERVPRRVPSPSSSVPSSSVPSSSSPSRVRAPRLPTFVTLPEPIANPPEAVGAPRSPTIVTRPEPTATRSETS